MLEVNRKKVKQGQFAMIYKIGFFLFSKIQLAILQR